MKQLNFSDAEKNQLLRVVAAILQLGNIVFGPNRDGSGSVVTNQDGTASPNAPPLHHYNASTTHQALIVLSRQFSSVRAIC
jgi:myosin heavy subunit